MNINGVIFPDSLLNALRDSRLVIFAGAGVSMGAPANLPDFPKLASQIAEVTGQAIRERETEDRFLGRLKEIGIDVHRHAAKLLQRNGPELTELHRDLLRLSTRLENVRVVTTNFDLLLEQAAADLFGAAARLFLAPALPYGQRFQGIVHIHGSVSEPDEMVLTSQDFGRAYLTESDGWARRFLVDLFASHTVLFVGYSHNDTIMTYLTPSLPPDSAGQRYAIIGARSDEPERWRNLGIEPIAFPQEEKNDYAGLNQAVSGLAHYIQFGILDWQQHITRIAEGPPPLEEESASVIEHALTNPLHTSFFTKAAESPEWIAWLDNRKYLDALFSYGDLNEQEKILTAWLPRLAVNQPDALFSVIKHHDSRINPLLWQMIGWQMGRTDQPPPDSQILSRWVHFLISAIPPEFNGAMLELLAKNCATKGLLLNLLQIYDTMTASRRQTDPQYTRNNSNHYGYQIRTLWEQCLKPKLPELAERLLERSAWRLEERHSLRRAWEGEQTFDSDTFFRSAIEPHEQNRYPEGIDALTDIARDCLEWLGVNQPEAVKQWSDRYSRSPAPLLRRLAVYILPARTDLSADEKILWLLERCDMNELPAKHEIFRAIELVYPDASLELRRSFIDSVLSYRWPREDDPDRDLQTAHHNFDWLQWLSKAAPDCQLTKTELDNIASKYPGFVPSDHPDFNSYWSGFSWVRGSPSPWTVQKMLEISLQEWLPQALKEQPEEHPYEPRDQIIDNVKEATKQNPSWGLDLADEITRLEEWDTHIWRGIIQGLQETELDSDSLTKAVQVMSMPELHSTHGYDIANALSKLIVTNRSTTTPAALKLANGAARHLWSTVTPDDGMQDFYWLAKAINHQAGFLAEFWIQSIASWREHQELPPTALTCEYQDALSEIVANLELPGRLARVIFASRISFLTYADEEWTKRNLIPLLDHNHKEFESSWEGITRSPNFTSAAAELLKEPFLQAVEHINDSMTPENRGRFVTRYTSMLTWFVSGPSDQWIIKLLAGGNLEIRKQFTRQIGHYLQILDEPTQKEWWSTWLKEYWENRLLGIPTQLDAEEKETMIEWTSSLTAVFPDAVELAVRMPAVPIPGGILIPQLTRSDIPAKYPEPLAKLLIHLGEAHNSSNRWYGMKPIIDRLLQEPLNAETERGLKEFIAKFGL